MSCLRRTALEFSADLDSLRHSWLSGDFCFYRRQTVGGSREPWSPCMRRSQARCPGAEVSLTAQAQAADLGPRAMRGWSCTLALEACEETRQAARCLG